MKLPISKLNYPSQPINDDTFVVVDKEVDGTWKSYKVRLSTIGEYINTIDEQPEPIIPADDGDEFEFNVAGSDNVRTLAAGTWECTIVGGGGGFYIYSQSPNLAYRGHSSPMIKGRFTLDRNTTCKFHVGDNAKNCANQEIRYAENNIIPEVQSMPEIDGYKYVWGGDPSYILMGDGETELTESNSIVAVKAQKWYVDTSQDAQDKNNPFGWDCWDAQQPNIYINRNVFTPDSDNCQNGRDGYKTSWTMTTDVSQGKTEGTDYGRTPGWYYYTTNGAWDEVCQQYETIYHWGYRTQKIGGYIHVKRLS